MQLEYFFTIIGFAFLVSILVHPYFVVGSAVLFAIALYYVLRDVRYEQDLKNDSEVKTDYSKSENS